AAFVSMRPRELPVRADRAQRGTILSSISTNGKIEAVNNFEAHAPAAARVQVVHVHEGDAVKAGQLLVELDDAAAHAEAARAESQLRSAQANLRALQKGGTPEDVMTNRAA